ncbi:hypothetical protein BT96DRAFT_938080 [Gymnopus androsaceus JB14]|uniref:Uncharacterized protein n=1 Tax=Gymnopus androsaceus JB14 TaxID=1447944 RepID=A0A6A4HU42_9AGAR|nr:hypothetical protein BT96DRAFT_938080 [Gymnopus androsaceus JB14]
MTEPYDLQSLSQNLEEELEKPVQSLLLMGRILTNPFNARRFIKSLVVITLFLSHLTLQATKEKDGTSLKGIGNSLEEEIVMFLESYQPQMDRFVRGEIDIPYWTPESESIPAELKQSPKVPVKPYDTKPDMLLHKLGRFQDDKILKGRLDALFGSGVDKIFVNTSGAGKTRLVLEQLCSKWGLYFTCHEESRVGSSDLATAIEEIEKKINKKLPHRPNFPVTKEILDEFSLLEGKPNRSTEEYLKAKLLAFRNTPEGIEFEEALNANQDIVACELLVTLLARLLVFRQFLETLNLMGEDLGKMSHKRRWLLLQLHTSLLSSPEDIFTEVIGQITRFFHQENRVQSQTQMKGVLEAVLKGTLLGIRNLLSSNLEHRLLYVTVDECQYAAKKMENVFYSDDLTKTRAILRELAKCWRFSLLIYGKTQKLKNFDVEFSIGYKEGRHRFTAEFISLVLQNGYANMHQLLNLYIKNVAGFTPADYDGPEVLPESAQATASGVRIRPTQRKDERKDQKDLSYLHFDIRDPDSLGTDEREYIECGFARFTRSSKGDRILNIDEPLVLLSCTVWFNKESTGAHTLYKFLCDRIEDHNPSTGRNGFEEFISLYLQRVFRTPRQLNTVFDFEGAAGLDGGLGNKMATLYRTWGATLLGPLGKAIYESDNQSGISALTDWLKFKGHTSFCFPMNHVGPDIMCVLKLHDPITPEEFHYVWLSVQCKFYKVGYLPPLTLREAIATVTPREFFELRKKTSKSKAMSPQNQAKDAEGKGNREKMRMPVLKALHQLPHKDPLAGKYGVIRVVCGFPVDVDLSKAFPAPKSPRRSKKPRLENTNDAPKKQPVELRDPDKTDGHPLARLNPATLITETKDIHPTELLIAIKRCAETKGSFFDENDPAVKAKKQIQTPTPASKVTRQAPAEYAPTPAELDLAARMVIDMLMQESAYYGCPMDVDRAKRKREDSPEPDWEDSSSDLDSDDLAESDWELEE